jgi:hypothetical protein
MATKSKAIECEICFEDFTEETITTHDCRIFCCGACGELLSHKDGKIVMNQGLAEFHHNADLCPANDEIEEEN